MTGHEVFDELVAGYALDALSGDDRRRVEQHLATCVECRTTLGELRRVSAGIGLSVEPIEPPDALRARVLAGAVAGFPPTVPDATTKTEGRTGVGPAWAWLATAALVSLVAGLGVYAWALRGELLASRQTIAELSGRAETLRRELSAARLDSIRLSNTLNVLGAADVLRVDLRGDGAASAASGLAYVSADSGVVFNARGLPRLAEARTYQLWVIPAEGTTPVSVGLFTVGMEGSSSLAAPMPAGVARVAAVAVSDEPAGGSPSPTTSPLMVGRVVVN